MSGKCCNVEAHKMHYCQLKIEGKEDCLKGITDNPTVECKHCGAKVNSTQYVCAAHLEGDAPNVEGGHGTVGLEDVGKPHAGHR